MLQFQGLLVRMSLATAAALAVPSIRPALAQGSNATPAPAATAAPPAGATPPAGAAPSAVAEAPPPDTVVAKVNGQAIRLSDLSDAAKTLPPQMQGVPAQVLYPMLLDQLIDRQALTDMARKTGLDKDPAVQRQMTTAADRALQTALITKEVGPKVTEDAVRARYDQDMAGKPGEEEVHARHILVPTEAEAKEIIAQLKKGGDFAALAKQHSKDPGAAQGGDLGFFKKGDMVPEFADAAFALQPGQVTQEPVHTQFGWHVIKVEERKRDQPPPFEQAHDELRQKMVQEDVQKILQEARNEATIEKFNPDGSSQKPQSTGISPADQSPTAPSPAPTSSGKAPAGRHPTD
jgi:peptidyl-prolyl cis-trans isomerase C